ncbi:MAG: DNA-deoxyinosine glycosylase [Lachnospiraceae bacterium]|nr:DNA-deoxyinosine glycosylase [Lachnospiraceae bacterium]
MKKYENIQHEFQPVFDTGSQILILGTFPSVKSREQNFYYGHPQNRFWKVLARLTGERVPGTIDEKKEMLLKHGIAIWDVIASCDIVGSSDSSIKNVVPSNLHQVLDQCSIKQIYANGNTAKKLFEKYQKADCGRDIIGLPSTSPANAAFQIERLLESWRVIKQYLI